MVERKEYLQRLISWKDDQVIKVLTRKRMFTKRVEPSEISGGFFAFKNKVVV